MIHRYLLPRWPHSRCSLSTRCSAAWAHPHVWVTVKSELLYAPDGSVTGVRHAWTFDDMFSVFATQGIEAKKKGQFTREELAPLAEVNVGSLKEYDFFTHARADGKPVEFNEPPAGYFLEFDPKDTVLTLHLTLPLKAPVKAKDFTVEVFDREFFVDFSFAEKNPAKLVGAPAQCKLSVLKSRADECRLVGAAEPARRQPARSHADHRLGIRQQDRGEMSLSPSPAFPLQAGQLHMPGSTLRIPPRARGRSTALAVGWGSP